MVGWEQRVSVAEVHHAVGVLAARFDLPIEDAATLLRVCAAGSGLTLDGVARAVMRRRASLPDRDSVACRAKADASGPGRTPG